MGGRKRFRRGDGSRERGREPPAASSDVGDDEDPVAVLEARVRDEAPPRGYAPPLDQKVAFRSLPLSENTLVGLEHGDGDGDGSKSFVTTTEVQHAAIPHALAGRDVLAAAKTGSGKTLAFLVPTLEALYRARWSPRAGTGALILSPTRELAAQIFDVLRRVGRRHDLSAGLLTGGKREFREERRRVGTLNVIVATPGRLNQHLEQSPDLDVSGVRVLVLDEADRLLDMGFREDLSRILERLPTEGRQTMLFSATQTRSVRDLAALSMREDRPEHVFVHDHQPTTSTTRRKGKRGDAPTPAGLREQNVLVVPLAHKFDAIFSFLRSHLRDRTIVFFSSCAQVRHAHALLCALRPGLSVACLHGRMSQTNRTSVFLAFRRADRGTALIATDLAARGLDFPAVDWVLQADAPEDRDAYIHRVGRTARYKSGGRSLMLLRPPEKEGVTALLGDEVPLRTLSLNPARAVSVRDKTAALVAERPRLRELARKAFSSYLRSLTLLPGGGAGVGGVGSVDLEGYASSLGLPSAPSARFLRSAAKSRDEHRVKKNENKKLARLKEQIKAEKLAKRIARLGEGADNDEERGRLERKKEALEKGTTDENENENDDDDDDDDLLVVKKTHDWKGTATAEEEEEDDDDDDDEEPPPPSSSSFSRPPKRIRVEGSSSASNTRVRFDEEGNALPETALFDETRAAADEFRRSGDVAGATEEYVRDVRHRLEGNRDLDRREERERVREKRRRRKEKQRVEKEDDDDAEEEVVVTLGGRDDDEKKENESISSSDSDSDSDSSSDDDSDDEIDIKAQEELALSLIRKNAR